MAICAVWPRASVISRRLAAASGPVTRYAQTSAGRLAKYGLRSNSAIRPDPQARQDGDRDGDLDDALRANRRHGERGRAGRRRRAAAPAGRRRAAARWRRRAGRRPSTRAAEIVATAHSSSVCRARIELMVSRPRPRSAPVNSPTRAPRKAAGAATCRPAKRYGTHARARTVVSVRNAAAAVAGDEVGPRLRARPAARRARARASCRRRPSAAERDLRPVAGAVDDAQQRAHRDERQAEHGERDAQHDALGERGHGDDRGERERGEVAPQEPAGRLPRAWCGWPAGTAPSCRRIAADDARSAGRSGSCRRARCGRAAPTATMTTTKPIAVRAADADVEPRRGRATGRGGARASVGRRRASPASASGDGRRRRRAGRRPRRRGRGTRGRAGGGRGAAARSAPARWRRCGRDGASSRPPRRRAGRPRGSSG